MSDEMNFNNISDTESTHPQAPVESVHPSSFEANQPTYDPLFNQPTQTTKSGGSGLSVASMILGILSILTMCCCGLGLLLGIIGLILGIVGLIKAKSGMAIAGVITSGITVLFSLLISLLFIVSPSFQEGFRQGYEAGLEGDSFDEFWDDFSNENPFASYDFESSYGI